MSISPQARVHPGARIGPGVSIGDFTVVHPHVIIGESSVIESHCVIGYPTPLAKGNPLIIGRDSLIRSHSVFYQGSSFGGGLRTGHRVTVRELVVAGDGLQIGSLSDFQGHTLMGKYVRTHSNVHIGQGSKIGDFCWIFPYVVLTNDPHPPSDGFLKGPTLGDYAIVATMSCVLPGIKIGERSLVAAQSLVTKDVPPDMIAAGVPAQIRGPTSMVLLRDGSRRSAYPWMRHFHRGYPPEIVAQWKKEFGTMEP